MKKQFLRVRIGNRVNKEPIKPDKSWFMDITDKSLGLKLPFHIVSNFKIETDEELKEFKKVERKGILEYLKSGELPFKRCKVCKKFRMKNMFITPITKKATKNGWCLECLKEYHNKIRYNLSTEAYNKILKYQDEACAICERLKEEVKLTVDHDHKTSEVRGLLCNRCNSALGQFKDNKQFLLNAINYLDKRRSG